MNFFKYFFKQFFNTTMVCNCKTNEPFAAWLFMSCFKDSLFWTSTVVGNPMVAWTTIVNQTKFQIYKAEKNKNVAFVHWKFYVPGNQKLKLEIAKYYWFL